MRFIKICWILSKNILFYKVTSQRRENFGQRLKVAFEQLGITFIKIGQILSMRYDLLSKESCAALQQLLDKVNPIPLAQIHKIIEREYGKPHYEIFKKLYEEPLGSASVSQVHKAELFDCSIVAVKIKRPNVDAKFAADMRVLKTLAAFAQWFSRDLRTIQVRKLVDYFEEWIRHDLDFRNEVKNIEKIQVQYDFAARGFRQDLGRAFFPKAKEALCTANIIVMDYIDGIPMSNKQAILSAPDYDIVKSIKSFANAACRNWFREDISSFYFQADPHLSNVLALPNGDAANIDFGLIFELTKAESKICKELMIAVYLKDINQTLRTVAKMVGKSLQEVEIMRPDLTRYLEQTSNEGFGYWFLEIVRICVRYRFSFPVYLITFGRSNILMDGLIHEYLPDMTTTDILGEELRRQAVQEIFNNVVNADWVQLTHAVSKKINEGPKIIAEFLDNPLKIVSEVVRAAKNA